MSADNDTEDVSGEVILSEVPASDEWRRVRVYDRVRGDFVLELPPGCRMTFGYFNPAAPRMEHRGYEGPGGNTMRTTCLRIYADSTDKRQIAAFLGVDGFRDLSVKLTRLKQRVTIETNVEDDGAGFHRNSAEMQRMLNPVDEDEAPF